MLGAIFFSFLGSFYLLEQTVFAFFFSLGCARAGDEAETARCEKYSEPVGRSGPNLEPGTMRVYVTNGRRNGLNICKKVGPCPGSRRGLELGLTRPSYLALSVFAFLGGFSSWG